MGEAKRRSKAFPYVETTAGQMLRKLNAMAAALPPAPMNGATLLELSPGDYKRVTEQVEMRNDCFNGAYFLGLQVRPNSMLSDSSIIGRRRGKAVWSNNPRLQDLIDSGGLADDPAPSPSTQEAEAPTSQQGGE